jgi:hypothetical protein
MLRIVVTALITAFAVIGWIVINPADSGRQFLDTLGLLEVMQENYTPPAGEDTPTATPSTPPPAPGTALPRESNTAVRPGQAPPPLPPSSTSQAQANRLSAPPPASGARGQDYDRMIANLLEENSQLKAKVQLYEARRGNTAIPSSDRKALQRQIDANNARIAELKAWKAKVD